jgi:hypothetical protein
VQYRLPHPSENILNLYFYFFYFLTQSCAVEGVGKAVGKREVVGGQSGVGCRSIVLWVDLVWTVGRYGRASVFSAGGFGGKGKGGIFECIEVRRCVGKKKKNIRDSIANF